MLWSKIREQRDISNLSAKKICKKGRKNKIVFVIQYFVCLFRGILSKLRVINLSKICRLCLVVKPRGNSAVSIGISSVLGSFSFDIFKTLLVSAKNTGKILTNSGGTIRLTPNLKIKSSSQRKKVKGRLLGPNGIKVSLSVELVQGNYHCLCLCRFKTEVTKALESFVEKEDEFIKQV